MARFDESIDVHATVAEAYKLFSQFERFPGFMEGVEEVRRTGPDTLLWKAEIGGREEEWEAKITKEEPETAIAWQSVSGARNAGEVTFEKLDQDTTQVNLHIEYEPEGFVENVGALLGVVNGRMKADLKRFKEMVEAGGSRSGWHDPADRSQTAADRDRAIGAAERSVHRDDVGYESRDVGDSTPGDHNRGERNLDDRNVTNSNLDDRNLADRSGIAGAAGAAGAAAGASGRTVDSVGNVSGLETNRGGGAVDSHMDRAGNAMDRGLDRAGDAMNRGIDTAGNAVDRGLDRAGNSMDRSGNSLNQNVDRAGNAVDRGIDSAGNMAQDGVNRTGDAANRTTDRVSDMANRGAEKAHDWADRGADAADAADDDRDDAVDPLTRGNRRDA